jgi:hypothetical protein
MEDKIELWPRKLRLHLGIVIQVDHGEIYIYIHIII